VCRQRLLCPFTVCMTTTTYCIEPMGIISPRREVVLHVVVVVV
jgi:hypothetical protein